MAVTKRPKCYSCEYAKKSTLKANKKPSCTKFGTIPKDVLFNGAKCNEYKGGTSK